MLNCLSVTLMKIIISQSIARRWLETRKVKGLRAVKRAKAATSIQRKVRGYIAFNRYMESVVNLIICQAVSRRWIALRRAKVLSDERAERERKIAATRIETAYRRHVAYSSYTATLTDTILCQSYVRQWSATRAVNTFKVSRQAAAVVIQSAYWGYSKSLLFIITLSRIILLQSQVRGFIARRAFNRTVKVNNEAATTIQKYWRSYKAETDFM